MIRKFKTLGVALVAVFAMSAMVASAAQALTFTSASYPTTITGNQIGAENEFETVIGNVECSKGTFTGEAKSASSTLTLTPSYSGCLVGGLVSATVDTAGCDYLFHATGTDNATADVVCSAGNSIKVTVPAANCTITVGSQAGLSTITLKQNGNNVIADVKINNITYTLDQTSAGGCSGQSGTKGSGSYRSNVELSGTGGKVSFD